MRSIALHPPRVPYLSNVTGAWIQAEEATDPAYWAHHLRHTVRFSDCLDRLLDKPGQILIEAGPGNALTSLARQHGAASVKAFQSLPHPGESGGALRCALHTLGQLWTLGTNVDWARLHTPDSVRRVSLPTYPFEHRSFWIEPDASQPAAPSGPDSVLPAHGSDSMLFYRRVWKLAPPAPASLTEFERWLVFSDSLGLGDRIAASLEAAGQRVILVESGAGYSKPAEASYTVRPEAREDYDALIADVLKTGPPPNKILHLWSVLPKGASPALKDTQDLSFLSPLFLAQALASQNIVGTDIALVSNSLQQVSDEPVHNPARAVLLGLARVVPAELPGINCRSIDLDLENGDTEACAALLAEMTGPAEQPTVAFRRGQRFIEAFEPLNLFTAQEHRLESNGMYLITGGLGGIGLAVAAQLAREFHARLVLVGRSAMPPEPQWESSLNDEHLSNERKLCIRKLMEIRAAAGGLLVAQGDVTDLEQMRSVVARAIERFGKIDGVLHAAGVLDDAPLLLKTAQGAARVLDPKVRGTLVVEEALRDVPLRCFVLFSSVSSIVPSAGQVDYAAANAFLDAYALSRKGPLTVINWGAWRSVGMAARSSAPHPLLHERLADKAGEIAYASQFSQARSWVLSEHSLRADAGYKTLLPGSACLEMAAAAISRGRPNGAFEFQDVFFPAPLFLDADEIREVRVQLTGEQEGTAQTGAYRFSVHSRGSEGVEHSTGLIASCTLLPAALVDRSAIAARCHDREIVFDEEHRTLQERYLVFGPRWRSLRRLLLGKHEALAEIELDERFLADISAFRLHPAILDLATGASFYLTEGYEQSTDLFLPIAYKKMRLYHPLPGRLFSHIRPRHRSSRRNEVETFDITLFDEHGQVLAEIEGFAARRIGGPSIAFLDSTSRQRGVHAGGESPAGLLHRTGIEPAEGARALVRILSSVAPRAVIAVAEPLDLSRRNYSIPVTKAHGAVSPKTPLPGETVESTLAAWWREILGVDQVGLNDDFFNLGGHSLVGVRLLAKVKRTYRVDLDFGVLFEARTVSHLADVIRKLQSPADDVKE